MKKYVLVPMVRVMLGVLAVSGACQAADASQFIKANIEFKNTHGVVASGTWFSMTLQDNLIASTGSQAFTATLVDPIFNQNMTEGLIPANAVVNGTYRNDGKTCSFEIDTISFNDDIQVSKHGSKHKAKQPVVYGGTTEIGLAPGAYSAVNATLPNQPECNPSFNYGAGQHMEFQTKVDIAGLEPIVTYKDYIIKENKDNFLQTYGNSSYAVSGITKFTNGFMQINVRFYDKSIRNKLVPVYFDETGLPHSLNFTLVATDSMQTGVNDTSSYLILSHYNNFGFGVLQ